MSVHPVLSCAEEDLAQVGDIGGCCVVSMSAIPMT